MTSDVIGWESFEFKGRTYLRRHIAGGRIEITPLPHPKFRRGDRVRAVGGSPCLGIVCGEYSTALTPEGYVVENQYLPGQFQTYPAWALEKVDG